MTLRLGRGSPWGLGQGSKGVSVFFRPPSSSSGACKASLSSFGILSPFYRRVCLFVPLPLYPSSIAIAARYIHLFAFSPAGGNGLGLKAAPPDLPSPLLSHRVPIVFQFSTISLLSSVLSFFLLSSTDRSESRDGKIEGER